MTPMDWLRGVLVGGQATRIGECEGCSFTGLLRKKPVLPPLNLLTPMEYDPEAELPILNLCVTCFETPTGCVSDNARHIIEK